MKLPWSSRKNGGDGREPVQASPTDDGWVISSTPSLAESPVGAYADQLAEEGIAERTSDGYRIPWPLLYRIIGNEEHASSLGLLGLPAATALRPHLVSEGTPADSTFAIRLGHWVSPSGPLPASAITRSGAVIRQQSGDELLPEPAWELLRALHELVDHGPSSSPQERLLATGRIQSLARACAASVDGYLARTDVVVPERLDVDLVSEQAAGVPVVELVPRPDGAPGEWLDQFDAYNRVQPRYDVVQPGGHMTHVALPPEMRNVLEHVKAAPGRRFASGEADAFIHNPYPFLGDNAQEVLPPEAFEAARQRAGVIEREMDALPSDTGMDLLFVDISGSADDACESVSDSDVVKALLVAAAAARQSGLPLFRWRSYRIVLSGTTPSALHKLGEWLAIAAAKPNVLGVDEVFNLKAYSDRVVGFDGKPIHVPFLGKKDAARDWDPDNIQLNVSSTHPATGETTNVALNPDQVSQLERATKAATSDGSTTVRVPGTDMEIPIEEAREWLKGFDEGVRKQPIAPSTPKNPPPGHATSLRILHNIEALEYGAAVALPSPDKLDAVLPRALRQSVGLKQHQRDGLAWLQHRFDQSTRGVGGTLLADDMGLGKTLQCLGLMAWYRETRPNPKPCLVVAPVSLLENWEAEIAKFFDGTQGPTMLVYGQELARHRVPVGQMGDELATMGLRKLLRPGFAGKSAIVLTTYETLRDYELSFGRERWGILVCDEAQKIKTPGALVTRSAKAMQAEFKIACTGTPVENSLADLWCLFDFFQPALLGSLSEFTKVFRKTIELREEGHEAQVERLRRSIEPWILRRMKSEVAELPPKIDETHEQADPALSALPMSPLQRKLYGEAVIQYRRDKQNADADDRKAGTLTLALLHRLRLICSNPLAAAREDAEHLSVDENIQHSPKLRWLLDRLRVIQGRNEKAIVFTEYRQIQRLLRKAIEQTFKIDVSVVNGATTVDSTSDQSRQKVIDQFQSMPGFAVIVLSTTAVGFGVNIQKANHVIHFTRPWNPAKEDQATDRAYRIGQEKPVWVYCPTLAGDGFESFEQRLAERLARKRTLSQDLLAPEQSVNWKDFEDLVE